VLAHKPLNRRKLATYMPEVINQFDFSEVEEKISQHKELDFNNLECKGPSQNGDWLHYISENNVKELGK